MRKYVMKSSEMDEEENMVLVEIEFLAALALFEIAQIICWLGILVCRHKYVKLLDGKLPAAAGEHVSHAMSISYDGRDRGNQTAILASEAYLRDANTATEEHNRASELATKTSIDAHRDFVETSQHMHDRTIADYHAAVDMHNYCTSDFNAGGGFEIL